MMKGIRGLLEKDFRLFFRQGGNLFFVLVFVALFFIPMIGCISIMSRAIMKNLKGLMFQKIHWYTLEILMSLVR